MTTRELLSAEATRLRREAQTLRGAGSIERAFKVESDYRKICAMLQQM
jgi:hypothetical protein